MVATLVLGTAVCVLACDHRLFLIIVQIMNIRNTPVKATPPKTPPMMAPVGVDLETDFVAGRGREFEELTLDVVVVIVMLVILGSLLIIWILVVVMLRASVADNKMV